MSDVDSPSLRAFQGVICVLQLNLAEENGSTLNWSTGSLRSTQIRTFNFSFLSVRTVSLRALPISRLDDSRNFLSWYLPWFILHPLKRDLPKWQICSYASLLPTSSHPLSAG